MEVIRDISQGVIEAAARSEIYRMLAASFRFPSIEMFDAVASGEYREAMRTAIGAAPFASRGALIDAGLAQVSGFEGDFDRFCSQYIRLFEVGAGRGKPPCPLYGGEYARVARLEVMEELVRFYGFFDVTLAEADRELPDHISVELEFVHYLAFREGHVIERGGDASPLRRAQADFLERHPARWLPQMRAQLELQHSPIFFRGLAALASEITAADLEYLRSM